MKFVLFLAMFFCSYLVFSDQARIAIGNFSPDKEHPEFNYLAPIIEGLFLFDLSQKGGVAIVERNKLSTILREQEFELSGILEPNQSSKIGKILDVNWILYGQYSILNGEVLLTAQLTNVSTGVTQAFRERDGTEHVVHHAAEQIIFALSGRSIQLADAANKRSILSLRDEKPGSIAIYSKINNAKIFIDGEFVGFTVGVENQEILFDNLPPGNHEVVIRYARDFGILDLKKQIIGPFRKTIEVKPGRRAAILDESRALSDAINTASELAYLRITALSLDQISTKRSGNFQTPAGDFPYLMVLQYNKTNNTISLSLQNQKFEIEMPTKTNTRIEKKYSFEKLGFEITVKQNADDFDVRWILNRNELDMRNFRLEE